MAAKSGDTSPGTAVLRLNQPTNTSQKLEITLSAKPSEVTAVTALEDPIAENAPEISITDSGFTVDGKTALNIVVIR